jgi:hypothetical protein
MASFDFINGKVEGGSITGLTSLTTTGTPVALNISTKDLTTLPSTAYTGLTGVISGSLLFCLFSGSTGLVGTKIYVLNGLIVSASLN